MRDYSKITVPLKELLKKNKTWEWFVVCQRVFNHIKRGMTEELVLALSDHPMTLKVQSDASDYAIGGVLMLNVHPVAFEIRKLNEVEGRYRIQEKEMITVVHYLRTWTHYLLGSQLVVKTYNVATSYFQTQKRFSMKQA